MSLTSPGTSHSRPRPGRKTSISAFGVNSGHPLRHTMGESNGRAHRAVRFLAGSLLHRYRHPGCYHLRAILDSPRLPCQEYRAHVRQDPLHDGEIHGHGATADSSVACVNGVNGMLYKLLGEFHPPLKVGAID